MLRDMKKRPGERLKPRMAIDFMEDSLPGSHKEKNRENI